MKFYLDFDDGTSLYHTKQDILKWYPQVEDFLVRTADGPYDQTAQIEFLSLNSFGLFLGSISHHTIEIEGNKLTIISREDDFYQDDEDDPLY